jgi:tetratricopeptide (TPR) repeat protein
MDGICNMPGRRLPNLRWHWILMGFGLAFSGVGLGLKLAQPRFRVLIANQRVLLRNPMEARMLAGWAWAMDGIRVHYLPRRAWQGHRLAPFLPTPTGGDLFLPEDLREREATFVCRSLGQPLLEPALAHLDGRQRLQRALFERGVARLVTGMRTFSREDYDRLSPERKLRFPRLRGRLDVISRPLTERLDADAVRGDLDAARRSGNHRALAEAEARCLVRLHQALAELPWNADGNLLGGSDPFTLRQTKAMACIGHAYVAHAFLQAWGLAHWVGYQTFKDGDDHVVIRVRLADGRGFHLDPQEPNLLAVQGVGPREGAYTLDPTLKAHGLSERLLEQDAPALLQAVLMTLHGALLNDQRRYAEALPWQWESLRLSPEAPNSQVGVAFTLYQLGRRREALVHAQKAVEGAPGRNDFQRLCRQIRLNLGQT